MPVDDGETSNTAELQVHPSRGGEALTPKIDGSVTSRDDDNDDDDGDAASTSEGHLSYEQYLERQRKKEEEDVAGDDSDAARLSAIRDSEERTKKELAAMQTKIDKLTDMVQKLLDDKEQS